jgi:transposase
MAHEGGRLEGNEENEALFVGIDWASQKNDVCVVAFTGRVIGERQFEHSGEGLAQLTQWLVTLADGNHARLRVAIETPRGPVVETLLEQQLAVFSINPKQLDRFRDRFTVAGTKDDRLDARVLADSLRTDAAAFRRVEITAAELIELREWSRLTETLKTEQLRLASQMREQLFRYYPQFLELCPDLTAAWALELWKLLPTPQKAQQASEETVRELLLRVRRVDAPGALLILRKPSLRVAAGTVGAATAHIEVLVERLELVNRQLKRAEKSLAQRLEQLGTSEDSPGQRIEQRDVAILQSLPGVGRIVLATLLCEATQAIAERDYPALRTLAGVAPVTRRSGKTLVVIRRQACHHRLREAVYHWARVSVQKDDLCRAKYTALRARGHTHGRALRTIGDRLLAIACALLRTQTEYCPPAAPQKATLVA